MDDIRVVNNRSQPPLKYDLIHVNSGVVVTASFPGST